MSDIFTREKRSWIMSHVKGKDSSPELLVRKIVHKMGYRFRLHSNKLPGKPDIVLPKHRKVIFVHGCFWHGHEGCSRSKRPSSNIEFWENKITRTIQRDNHVIEELRKMKWEVLIIWQCEISKVECLSNKLSEFFQREELSDGSKR